MSYISKELREQVIKRAKGLCEYCQTAQNIVVEMEVDHILPISAGGQTRLENLGYACISCNKRKSGFVTALDPETEAEVSLFNPRMHLWTEHFSWDEGQTKLIGLTPTGRATIIRLKMNRDILIETRARWVAAGWHPPQ